jgi:uncharacterized protein (DUF983 family)
MVRHGLTTSFVRTMVRGAVGACPRCAGRGWFRHWFTRRERCPTCGYRHERQQGFMLGAMTMNVIVTFILLALVMLVGTVASYPDIAVVAIVVTGLVIAVGWPLFFYPMSYTLWAAVDLAMRPLEPAERADADRYANPAWLAAQSGSKGA